MNEEFERLSAIKPWKNIKFNLDRTLENVPKENVDNRSLLKKIRDCVNEFKQDGASHTWSTFRINGIIDATMNDEKAAMILSQLDSKRYFFRLKFIVNLESGDWVIRDKLNPILKDRKTVIASRDSKPGLLTGIDRPYYERAYPETAVVYGIYSLNKKPDIGRLAPMKYSSTLNCVAERVIEHFTNSLRGNKLTDLRRKKINEWELTVKERGATIFDIAKLETLLRFPITVSTITGEVLYKSKYNKNGAPIQIIDHNEHAWTPAITIFPRDRTVKYIPEEYLRDGILTEEGLFDAIASVCKNDPVSVWLLHSFEDEECRFNQFVRPNGELYRTENLHNRMKKLAIGFSGGENPSDFDDEQLLTNCFTIPSVAAHFARKKNNWKPVRREFLQDVESSCLEYYHGGLWNKQYDRDSMISVDIVACYPGSFLGYGFAGEYFKRFGHPTHEMTRVAINGPLPDFDLTGFARVVSFEFAEGLHPCSYIWIGRHMAEKMWLPIVLLRYMIDCKMLISLVVSEAIISYRKQTNVWLPEPESLDSIIEESRKYIDASISTDEYIIDWSKKVFNQRNSEAKDLGRRIIGKFTQGGKNSDYKRQSSRLIIDDAEYDFVIKDAVAKNKYINCKTAFLSNGTKLGTVITYSDGDSSPYTHLRASMLGYASINLLSMINRFPDTAVRVAIDSMYIDKKYINDVTEFTSISEANNESWGTWRIKNEIRRDYSKSADVEIKDGYLRGNNLSELSNAPPISDPVCRYKTVYLNGCGGSGKTTRVIELYRGKANMIVLTPTHRLAREIKQRQKSVEACTYHSFFRYKGDVWTPERMGEKFIPGVVIWDEACTVSEDVLKMFLDWLLLNNTKVILCGDHGQPPPFVGRSPHNWLKGFVDYYEEVDTDYRALDEILREFKKLIRLQPDRIQCEIAREIIPETPLNDFWETWRPNDFVVASRKIVRDTLQKKLFAIHKEKFPTFLVPLCYRPLDTRKQNIEVEIPGQKEKQILVLNDIVLVDISAVEDALCTDRSPWTLGYVTTIHSSQGLTITDTIVWIVDNRIEWSNLVYLAVSRVRRINQLRRIVIDDDIIDVSVIDDKIIDKKLSGYKQQDKKKQREFDIDAELIIALKQQQNNHCASCNCIMLWQYSDKDPRQFTVDRKNNSLGHVRNNVMLTCLECNRRNGAS